MGIAFPAATAYMRPDGSHVGVTPEILGLSEPTCTSCSLTYASGLASGRKDLQQIIDKLRRAHHKRNLFRDAKRTKLGREKEYENKDTKAPQTSKSREHVNVDDVTVIEA